jgi:hypothetical protein
MGIQYRVRMILGTYWWNPHHFRLYSKREIIDEVTASGLKVVQTRMIPVAVKACETDLLRLADAASRLYPNFAWRSGLVATKE